MTNERVIVGKCISKTWVIRIQLRKGGKIRSISKLLTHDQAMDFLSKIDSLYYGHICPRIWAHDKSEGVPTWERIFLCLTLSM